MHVFIKMTLPAIFLVLLVGIIAYSNTFNVPFVLDDNSSIVNNIAVEKLSNVFHAYKLGIKFIQNRIFAYLTFAFNFELSGLDVTSYHVVNLVIHLVASVLVYVLLRLTFLTPYFASTGEDGQSKLTRSGAGTSFLSPWYFIPLFSALLFVAHPVQTQAVTYIVQRIASMATMFYLLSMVLYVRARLCIDKNNVDAHHSGNRSFSHIIYFTGSVLAAVVAMKTKEIAFTLPLAIVLYEIFFFRGSWRKRLLYLLPLLATLPIIPLTILGFLDVGVDEQAAMEWRPEQQEQLRVGTPLSRIDYLFTQFRVIVTYLRLMLLPVNQNLDYDYPVYKTFLNPEVFLSFTLLMVILGAGVYLFFITRRRPGAHDKEGRTTLRLVAYGILWFFLTLSIESSLVPIKDVIMEHRLYLPFFGAATAFATILYYLIEKIAGKKKTTLLLLSMTVLVLALGVATYQRNHVWGTSLRLWQDIVSKSPNKARPVNNLGKALEEAGKRGEAFEAFSTAIKLDPAYYKAYYNLADLYLVSDQPEKALPLLQVAIQLNPDFTEAYVSVGAAFMRAGKFREVTVFLQQNLNRIADKAEARFYLGAAYAFLGNRDAAMRELDVLSRLDPSYAANLAGMMGLGLNGSGPHVQR
jgi:Flp pilus assembly protein TadD